MNTIVLIISFLLSAIFLLTIFYLKNTKSLKDIKYFQTYVKERKLTIEQQRELCERFNLPHHIGHRTYDSIDDWESELTSLWTGSSDEIQFLYRKYDQIEKRTIQPTEVGIDGNNKMYLKGTCVLNNSIRTFKFSRIESDLSIKNTTCQIPTWLKEYLQIDLNTLNNSYGITLK